MCQAIQSRPRSTKGVRKMISKKALQDLKKALDRFADKLDEELKKTGEEPVVRKWVLEDDKGN
jgi:hypothetical protein|tara:strand:+ start:25525 stop:25713 length:189 start_codon:yes stop_codon:yes gene_type:complete